MRNLYHSSMPPQPIEVVINARLRRKDVDQVVAVIGQYPFGVFETFDTHGIFAALGQLASDLFADSLDLFGIAARADDKVIGERRDLA